MLEALRAFLPPRVEPEIRAETVTSGVCLEVSSLYGTKSHRQRASDFPTSPGRVRQSPIAWLTRHLSRKASAVFDPCECVPMACRNRAARRPSFAIARERQLAGAVLFG